MTSTALHDAIAGLRVIANAVDDMVPEDEIDLSAAAAQVPEPSPEPSPERMQFALWDDGALSIYDGDDLLQIRPADVARLARLLGVPGCQLAGEEAV